VLADRFKDIGPGLLVKGLLEYPAFARVQGLTGNGEYEVDRRFEVNPLERLGWLNVHLNPEGNNCKINEGTLEEGTVLDKLNFNTFAQVPTCLAGTDLLTGFG
jgi:hypothetical protein